MTAGSYDINCVSGEELEVTFTIKNPDLTPAKLVYWDARMQVRPRTTSDTVIIELTTTNGRIVKDTENATITLSLSAEETAALSDNGVYSIELYSIGSKPSVFRLVQGLFNLG